MASRKFRFVSPGVFLKEIDNSQLPGIPDAVGPVIIGRTRKGPALTPYKVKSLEEFERVFGGTMPGNEGDDPWRRGTDLLAESYAPYAAKAYLSADIDSPVTIVRLAGVAGDDAEGTDAANPGWKTSKSYGLFLFVSASGVPVDEARNLTGTLAAVFYGDSTFKPSLFGRLPEDDGGTAKAVHDNTLLKEDDQSRFTIRLKNNPQTKKKDVTFSFDKTFREGFNTNPIKTNTNISDADSNLSELYWLGETFEQSFEEIKANKGANDALCAMLLELDSSMSDFKSSNHGLQAAQTGWFIGQDTSGQSTDIEPKNADPLFRAIARQEGFHAAGELVVAIQRINIPRDNATDAFGSFSLVVNELRGTRLVEVERFDNLNLNPSSENYVAKKIGTQYYKWDSREKRNKLYGTHPNISEYIRIEMHSGLQGKPPSPTSLVPFGFFGPIAPADIVEGETTNAIDSNGTGSISANNWVKQATDLKFGSIITNTGSDFRLVWPSVPVVNSGSLADGYMMGVSPFKQSWKADSKHTTETILNPGYVDYLRKYPEFTGLVTDQTSGIQANAKTKYSFIFTLDDVVLHPKNGSSVSSIEDVGDIVAAEYVSGSRNGVSTPAQATLSVSSPTSAHGMTVGQKITLIAARPGGADNLSKSYVLVDPALSDVDKTASSHVLPTNGTVLTANSIINGVKGTVANAIVVSDGVNDAVNGDQINFTVPTNAGGSGTEVVILFTNTGLGAENNKIKIDVATADAQAALIAAINGATNSDVGFSANSNGAAGTGVAGVTATAGDAGKVTLTLDRPGDKEVSVTNGNGDQVQNPGADYFSATAAETAATVGEVAVVMTGTQANVLNGLRTAILSEGGHDLVLTIEDGAKDGTMVVKQSVAGNSGETTITDDIDNLSIPDSGKFSGGSTISSYAKSVADDAAMTTLRPLLNVVDGFRAPLVGGFDGTDITEADPFNNRSLSSPAASTEKNYAYASVDRAIELISNAEMVEHNLAVMPGITTPGLTTKLVRECETRGDSLAIIDLPDVYVPPFQKKCANFEERLPSDGKPENSAKNLTNRQLNSSYGATYYPWVKIKDEVYNRDVWVPPSVVALGVMAFTEQRDEVWFAPAGFNRGGLNEGNAGVPVLQVSDQLMSKDRDVLYSANINPIASFVSEGIVIFGQKTLQTTQSALDRINVRRLLIFVKKRVSQISKDLLFEQNVRATWNRFLGQVNPFLESVKTRFGLSDYKVVLDSTTTTPDLVDRNILYAKVLLKPARAIEFIAVDFVITNTGASFED